MRLWRLDNFENPLPVPAKMAESGSVCKSSFCFRSHSLYCNSRFKWSEIYEI